MCKSEFIATESSETFPGLNVTSIDRTRCAFCIFPIHEQPQRKVARLNFTFSLRFLACVSEAPPYIKLPKYLFHLLLFKLANFATNHYIFSEGPP